MMFFIGGGEVVGGVLISGFFNYGLGPLRYLDL
jgi:hypothetical protein